jgi:heme-degrading monooxygenase HmoA
MYAIIWEFRTKPGRSKKFEAAYGPDGEWVKLFQKAAGYLKTDLFQDVADQDRFVTIDYWHSQAAFEEFKSTNKAEYEEVDKRCEGLTEEEKLIGCIAQ